MQNLLVFARLEKPGGEPAGEGKVELCFEPLCRAPTLKAMAANASAQK
jgi:hypothetical protein